MRAIEGGCHCGAVRYEAAVDTSRTIQCNCSHCTKKGFILAFTPRENLRITRGGDHLTEYRFNKHIIAHQFCSTCGTQAFALGVAPDGAKVAAINMRCVDGVDLAALEPVAVDGRSF